jgi:hypothetical protein
MDEFKVFNQWARGGGRKRGPFVNDNETLMLQKESLSFLSMMVMIAIAVTLAAVWYAHSSGHSSKPSPAPLSRNGE